MLRHNLVQGSPEWHAHRAKFRNASDAPAMMGVSKYKTRTELLYEVKTGLTKEVNSATQQRFDDGHRFEALARPLAEEIIGQELYPVTGSEDIYGASFDGLTMMDEVAFEHKTLNDEIRNCSNAMDLDIQYLVQMEQQLMVSGADMCLFMATKWDADNQLIEEKHFWYEPDLELRQEIIDGWAQFDIDLENHVPVAIVEKPKADVVMGLPALFIQAKGEITTHNMELYGKALAARLEEVRAYPLITDQDFANAKEAAKLFRNGIIQANAAKEAMLEQTVTVGEAARMIDAWCEDMRLTALKLEKDVLREDALKKQAMILAAQENFGKLVVSLNAKVSPIRLTLPMPQFAEAIKGKSKYASMQDAIDTLLSSSIAEANRICKQIIEKQEWLKVVADGYDFLLADLQTIIFKAEDDFMLLVETRIKTHKEFEATKAKKLLEDAEAKRIAEEEAETARLEQAKLDAFATEQAHKDDIAEAGKVIEVVPEVKPGISRVNKMVSAKPVYFSGAHPSANEIICALATAFHADEALAHKWLLATDFRSVSFSKAA